MPEPTTAPSPATTPTNGAPAPPPPAAAVPAKPAEKPPEENADRREALRLAADVRKRDKELAELRAKLGQFEEGGKKSAAERAELDALRQKDPRAWLERSTGIKRDELTRFLMSTEKAPQPHEVALKAAQEAQAEAARIREELAARDAKTQQDANAAMTAQAYRILRSEAAKDKSFAPLVSEMDENPRAWASAIRELADKHPEAPPLEIAQALKAQRLAYFKHPARLAYLREIVNTPDIAEALGLAQPTTPAAPPGTTTPKTITAKLAGERSAAPEPKVSPIRPTRARIEAGVRKLAELQAQTRKP